MTRIGRCCRPSTTKQRGLMEAEHAGVLQQLRESSQSEREGMRLRFERQTADLTQQHQDQLQQLQQEHDSTLERLKSEHAALVKDKDQLHADEVAGLRARQARDAQETRAAPSGGGRRAARGLPARAADGRRAAAVGAGGQG